jgi:hypothetical protein
MGGLFAARINARISVGVKQILYSPLEQNRFFLECMKTNAVI